MQLQQGVTEKLANTLIPAKQYVSLFEKHGYQCVASLNLLSATKMIFLDYHDPEGPLKEDWRVGTNEFGLANDNVSGNGSETLGFERECS